MSCTSPIYALDLGVKENGKRNIRILSKRVDLSSLAQLEARYGKGNILPLPCGKCLACKLSKAREWAVRCVLEASQYDDNCFITLTYEDKYLPIDGKLDRKAASLFLRRMKERFNIRYFGCGEYGQDGKKYGLPYGRPHFHFIIFGWYPSDLKRGVSKTLSELWPYGFVSVDDVNFRTCDYVARYTTKKIFGCKDDSYICMSTHPGIGRKWLNDNFHIFNNDRIFGPFGSGNVSNIPRYFEKVFEVMDPEALAELKALRIDKGSAIQLNEMLVHGFDRIEKLYDYKNDIAVHDFERKGKRKDL